MLAESLHLLRLDLKLIRERPDFVRERLAKGRAGDAARIVEVLASDELRPKLLAAVERLKAKASACPRRSIPESGRR